MAEDGFRLPNDSQRSFIGGMTGSGKTRAAAWQLSLRSYDRMPWVIVDFKHDDLIARIEHIEEIRFSDRIPKGSGLYVIRPRPDEIDQLQDWMWQVWERGRIGLWIDEGFMISHGRPSAPAYDAILTQGRSKRIPVITLAQRPAWLTRFVLSESDFFQTFHFSVKADRDRVREFTVPEMDRELPRYWSHWYDVARRFYTPVRPVPDDDTILETFHDRLKPTRRFI